LHEQIRRLNERVEELEQRNQELEVRNAELATENKRMNQMLHEKGAAKEAKAPVFKENYSVEQQTGKKSKRGREATERRHQEDKLSLVSRDLDVYPDGVAKKKCIEQRQQNAWRIIEGRAEYVCYHIYDLVVCHGVFDR
jgi:TolA-binding protein